MQTITYDGALRDKLIVGSPERVTDRLMGLQETLGLDGILCEMNCGTKIPHERVMKPNFHTERLERRPPGMPAGGRRSQPRLLRYGSRDAAWRRDPARPDHGGS